MDTLWILFLVFFFVFGMPIIFLIFYFERFAKPIETAKMNKPQEVIVKEIVMIPCQYCRELIPQTSTFCPRCGAPRKA